ncbi:MAG: YegP family protein [Clostridia bacterium]|nr:YegP family protein [Clostridia bacterium]
MGKFVVRKTKTGFKFDLKAGNGEIIATSEVYKTKGACLNGVKSVIANAPKGNFEDQTVEGFEKAKHPKFEMYTDKAGEFRFRLKATNGQIIATSEGYNAKAGCLNGIESVKKNAAEGKIEEKLD